MSWLEVSAPCHLYSKNDFIQGPDPDGVPCGSQHTVANPPIILISQQYSMT